jgi:hypothetical protein
MEFVCLFFFSLLGASRTDAVIASFLETTERPVEIHGTLNFSINIENSYSCNGPWRSVGF